MSPNRNQSAIEFYAATYDACVPDWPGEIIFYQEIAETVKPNGGAVLEIACGTGRVAARLARPGLRVVGLDLSAEMLAIARQKAEADITWVQMDMRSFELGKQFDLVIIPGHSFQNLNSPADQVACLRTIKRHLIPGGSLLIHLDHQDFAWLGGLVRDKAGVFRAAEQFTNPATGRLIHTSRAWSYEPATQTAICQTVWEEVDDQNQVLERWQKGPTRLHCIFRFEMEHLFARTGYDVKAVYGDFYRNPLQDSSSEMIWLAKLT